MLIAIAMAAIVAAFFSMLAAVLLGGGMPILCMACALVIAWAAAKADEKRHRRAAKNWKPVGYNAKTWGA